MIQDLDLGHCGLFIEKITLWLIGLKSKQVKMETLIRITKLIENILEL